MCISSTFLGVCFNLFIVLQISHLKAAEYLDGIAAVVEDDIILKSELAREVVSVTERLKSNQVQLPPDNILYKQVLERLIIDTLQGQLAKKAGVNVGDERVNDSLLAIAQQNGLDMPSFKREIAKQGMDFAEFKENVRKEIIVNQLRSHEIGGRVKVSDQEIKHFLETEMSPQAQAVQYLLGHILIAVSEGASSDKIQAEKANAYSVIDQLQAGADFKKMAVSVSDGANALKGGDLGWRTLSQVPTLFVDAVKLMSHDDISEPIRSPGGFHILKLFNTTGNVSHMIVETHARHILIKTNELINDAEAKKRLAAIAERIADGDDFAALAKAHSDDIGSAIKGGDLGWVMPGLLVPPFEKAMSELKINNMSGPIQTQFGWHLIQVLGRQDKDNREEQQKNQARNEIRKRKIEEETELWLRRLRDEAYVDIRLGALND